MKKIKILSKSFILSLVVSSCCGGPVTTNIVKVVEVEFSSDTIVPVMQNFEFDLTPIDSILTSSIDTSEDCSEGETHNNPIHFITDVKVFAISDFSNQYLSNSMINDLVSVEFYNSNSHNIEIRTLNSWMDYVRSGDNNTWKVSAFANGGTFIINQRPTLQASQIFNFVFTLSDNTILVTQSENITWN